jgi:AcrR family transcriptional regulator
VVHFFVMAYRATEKTEAKRTATRERIVAAAHALIAHGGYREAPIAAVAARAGVATGTVYRHFPSKADLFAEVFRQASQREVDAVAAAIAAAPTREAKIAAGVETFARRALRGRRLAWALLAEPVDPAVEAERLVFRRAYADTFSAGLRPKNPPTVEKLASGERYSTLTATMLVGAIAEALVGPLSPVHGDLDENVLVADLVAFCVRGATE